MIESAPIIERECQACHDVKPVAGFYKDSRTSSGLARHCAQCQRARVAKWRLDNPERYNEMQKRSRVRNAPAIKERSRRWYVENHGRAIAYRALRRELYPEDIKFSKIKCSFGITREQYFAMLEKQAGRCAICGRTREENGKRKKMLAVDHCHKTNRVRGLLCAPCNSSIGLMQESPEILQKAIQYLISSQQPNAVTEPTK